MAVLMLLVLKQYQLVDDWVGKFLIVSWAWARPGRRPSGPGGIACRAGGSR